MDLLGSSGHRFLQKWFLVPFAAFRLRTGSFSSALVKSPQSSISYLEHMGSSLVEQPSTERSVVPISLSSKLVSMEVDGNSYQFEGGSGLSSRPTFKRARWEELNLDAAFCRQSNGTNLPAQVSNAGGFSVSMPNYSSCGNGNGHSSPPMMSVQCSPFVNQQLSVTGLPYVSTVNSHVSSGSAASPVLPHKQGSNTGSPQRHSTEHHSTVNTSKCQATEQHSTGNTNVNSSNDHHVNVAEVLAELGRERQKNAELLDKLSSLEAQLEGREKASAKPAEQEHVLYEQPGVRRKIFYPNRQNPILCPVRILEEEKAMRPSGPSCPSCLFLCIKYGGRTRNLPQNEYVRQRMGRNKLKSFGPLMCQMALLVHIRTGSFFFKALGITLLFMAGFPDDLVQKETKYRNLDLLQKYYRPDEDAEGEELFHPYPMFYAAQAMINAPSLPGKGVSAGGKSSGKRQPPLLLSKPHISQKAVYLPPISARSMTSAQFAPLGFPPGSVPSGATLPTLPPHPLPSAPVSSSASGASNVVTTASIASRSGPFPPPPYAIFPPYALQRPPNGFLPVPMWHNVNSYPPNIYPSSSYSYQSFTPSSQYGSHPSQPYYNQAFFHPFPSNVKEGMSKKDDELDESDSDSESSCSEAEEKQNRANVSESKVV